MSATISQELDANLYLADETAWLETMAALIECGRFNELDYLHLQEYLTDMARRDRREVKSRLIAVLVHVLKWEFQQDHRSPSWATTLETQRQELLDLWESKSLRLHAEAELHAAHKAARRLAASETTLPIATFPPECPYALADIERGDWIA